MFKYFVIFLWCFRFRCIPANSLIVETKNGLLLGEDRGYYRAYKTIPYARAPIGELRFEAPQRLSGNWSGVRSASPASTVKCLQWNPLNKDDPIDGSEDCLFLNIFVPVNTGFESSGSQTKQPVMVFIHGGGFMWGSADFYGEEYIMEHGGMILVTLNYRLGAFGFLSTEDEVIPGNMGLKDQSLALQWIHENIEFFGGDSKKIILTGWSAGGASVHFHMVSELTDKKWFQSAASFSGSALCPCHAVYAGEALKKAKLLAEYLNCSKEELSTSRGLGNCLKSRDSHDIIRKLPHFYKFSNHPFAIFGPVIEKDTAINTSPFLTNNVEYLMRNGRVKVKPWLIARTAEDGAFGTAEFLKRSQRTGGYLIDDLNDNWSQWAPIMLFFNESLSIEEKQKLADDLKRRYFGANPISLETYKSLENLFNDELSTNHIAKTVDLYANLTTNAQCYGYIYDNPAPYGLGNMVADNEDLKFGTIHGDDVFLIFKTPIRMNHPFREDEKITSRNLIEMLIRLAETGIPVYDGESLSKLNVSNEFKFNTITKDGLTK